MESSQIKCGECKELLKNTDVIYNSTQCGHLFHKACLLGKSICPNCDAVSYPRYHRRIYPNFKTYNWMYINPQTSTMDGEDCSPFALQLGATEKGQPIYAARQYGKNGTIPMYYVPDGRCCFEDIKCTRSCGKTEIAIGIEILDISRDKDCIYKSEILNFYNTATETDQIGGKRLKRSESVKTG